MFIKLNKDHFFALLYCLCSIILLIILLNLDNYYRTVHPNIKIVSGITSLGIPIGSFIDYWKYQLMPKGLNIFGINIGSTFIYLATDTVQTCLFCFFGFLRFKKKHYVLFTVSIIYNLLAIFYIYGDIYCIYFNCT